MTIKDRQKIENGESIFTGGLLGLIGLSIASYLLGLITLGIATPWLICWKESWYAEHTYIEGKRLEFDGTGGQLIGKWLLWLLLTLITLGIFSFWIPIKTKQWCTKHTRFMVYATPKANTVTVNGEAPQTYTPEAKTLNNNIPQIPTPENKVDPKRAASYSESNMAIADKVTEKKPVIIKDESPAAEKKDFFHSAGDL